MSSNDQYQQINHFQELINIDKKVSSMNTQLDKIIEEIQKFSGMADELKKHSKDYRRLWSTQNTLKYQQILEKCSKIDMSLENIQK